VISRADLDYALPPERIAQEPCTPRDAARLLVLERRTGELSELRFSELADAAAREDLFVVNDTRVVPAKLRGVKRPAARPRRCARPAARRRLDGALCARAAARARARAPVPGLAARVVEVASGRTCRLEAPGLDGSAPRRSASALPPYIRRDEARAQDLADYQTIFAREPGAVAAPTASLHFSESLAARLRIARVTLHVGPGTFKPMRCERPEDHVLDPERFAVSDETAGALAATRAAGGRVTAVGTTVVRALETTGGAAGSGDTKLLILPGHDFRAVDSLVTNFHLPARPCWRWSWRSPESRRPARLRARDRAGFRFYSYGDALWIR
jgi:S-adenosylmethionine:tRNA ribosyltransferase-isomerase